ncbi:MAG: hypothetical protein ACYC05_15005 [Sulfuricella sp.]
MKNFLEVDAAEFKLATRIFCGKRRKLGPALLAFEGGFLSLESGDTTAVMRATGEWHGRATFSAEVLRALAMVPPAGNPIVITYADGHLLVSSLTIACQWHSVSQAFIHDLENPKPLDLLVLERTLPRAEMDSTSLGKKIRATRMKLEQRLKKATAQLEDFEITEAELREMVETRIKSRLGMAS